MIKINKLKINMNVQRVNVLLCSLAIFFSMFPMSLAAYAEETEAPQIMVSIGDSYSSGEGIEPFYGQDEELSEKVNNPDWLAHRSQDAWPGMLSLPNVEGTMADNRGTYWYFAAASGAVTDNLLQNQTKEYKKGEFSGSNDLVPQLDIFDELGDRKADYVTLTLGGNDADFAGVITDVVVGSTYLNCSILSDKINKTWEKFYQDDGIADNLRHSYEAIAEKAGPQAQIIVAGYPKLLDSSGKGLFVSQEEATMVNIAVSNFNNAIEHIVNQCSDSGMKICFVSVEEAFEGHGAYAEDPYINEVSLWLKSQDLKDVGIGSAYSIHPNYKGACAYAKCVQAKINELEGLEAVVCSTDLSISTYDYYGELCDDYRIIVEGKESIALWGLISKDYYDEITVNQSSPILLSLPQGTYTITVTDGVSSHFQKIKVRSNSDNNELNFFTNFGYADQTAEDVSEGQYQESDIPNGAVMFNNHWYKAIEDDAVTDWEAALQYCTDRNGYLATITSQEENDFLFEYMKQSGYSSAYFGFTDETDEGIWKWSNGEQSAYTNWHAGEPNSENSNEDYALFYYKYSDGTWNDGDFGGGTVNGGTVFICEWGAYEREPELQGQESTYTASDEREIVLVLDTSGSMSGTPMEETKKAATNFIETTLKQDAGIGFVTYSSSAACVADFTMNEAALKDAVSSIHAGGYTNIDAGLSTAQSMLQNSNAKKKIIVLMSDGMPNEGREGDSLIAFADEIKSEGILIYTLGFFEELGSQKSAAQYLMEQLASDGCHYEVANAEDLVFFFEDMADQINGTRYIYIRIACPVDVSVSYKGETLSSAEDNLSLRTDFGTLTFEENQNASAATSDDRIKVLRLKEGVDYDIQIVGTGRGIMDYTIGFMDEDGEYSDLREFEDIKISKTTVIDTVATVSDETILNIDEDGDGKYDIRYRARENGYGEEIKSYITLYIGIGVGVVALILLLLITRKVYKKLRKRQVSKMAKFCGNCGARLDDKAKVCGNCGVPLNRASSSVSGIKVVDPEKEKEMQKKVKKTMKLCAGLVVLIFAAVIAFNVITAFTGYNGLLRKAMAAYEDYDIDALVNMSSDMYYYGSEDYVDRYFESAVGNALDSFESSVGHSYKLSYEINEIYTLSNRNLDSMLDSISWMYSEFDISVIEKIAVADITVTAQQGSKSANRDLKVTMSKEDGTWKLLYID